MFTANSRAVVLPLLIQGLMLFTDGLHGMKPYRDYLKTPQQYYLVYDSLSFKTSDNYQLVGWMLRPPNDRKEATIILSYGDAGNMSYFLDYGNEFYSRGYNVLLYDYRGFGASQYFSIDGNMLIYPEFLSDLNAAIDVVKKNYGTDIILFGHSMGAMVSLGVAGQREDIMAVVVEGPGLDMETTQQLVNKWEQSNSNNPRVYKIPPDYPELAQPIHAVKLFNQTPLYIFTGAEDEISTPENIFRLYEQCPAKIKVLWIAPSSDHSNIIFNYTDEYFNNIYLFLDRVLSNK